MPVAGLDAPTGGLNGFDSVDSMPPTDAVILENWLPRPGYCISRPGYTNYSDDLSDAVETLTAYEGTSTQKLIAGANGNLYTITSGGSSSIGSGYTNDRWQGEMISNKLIFCNGADAEMAYDGSSLTALDYTGSSPAITPGQFVGMIVFKGRALYWGEGEQAFWYATAGAYQGNITEFPMGTVLNLGGTVISLFVWTLDSGTGPDDLLGIITDQGEVVLYQGDDPASSTDWAQVGKFYIPRPLSIRGTMKYGSDVIIMTVNGYVNMSSVLKIDQISDPPEFSRKISRFVLEAGADYADNYGHECILTELGFMLFNVPVRTGEYIQYVKDTSRGAWCKFTNWDAITFCTFMGETYFGSYEGYVKKIGGYNDGGDAIELNGLPAYNYFGDSGRQKHLVAAGVLSTFPDPKLIALTGFADFVTPELENVQTAPGSTGGVQWDSVQWDTSDWFLAGGDSAPTTRGWQNISSFGFAVTAYVQMKVKFQPVTWRQTLLRFTQAGAQ